MPSPKAPPASGWFGRLIDERLVEEDSADERIDPGWHHPSGFYSPCLRRRHFSFLGMPRSDPESPNLIMLGHIGTFVHELIQDMVRDDPRVSNIESDGLKLEDPVTRVRGTDDLVVADYDGVRAVMDLKTTASNPRQPKDHHILQGAWYLYLTGAKRFILQYIARSSGAKRRFTLSWGELEVPWRRSVAQIIGLNGMTSKGQLAPKTPRDGECGSCVFLTNCLAVDRGENDLWQSLIENVRPLLGDEVLLTDSPS